MSAHILKKLSNRIPIWLMKLLGNIWLPFLGAGIKIVSVSKDYRHVKVCLKRRWYNSNYVGTQFGGSIYSMTDPFFMLMLINNLGRDYIVWDKGARVDFKKPGRTHLYAEFRIDEALLNQVRDAVAKNGKYIFELQVDIFDENGINVASVDKVLYVKAKS